MEVGLCLLPLSLAVFSSDTPVLEAGCHRSKGQVNADPVALQGFPRPGQPLPPCTWLPGGPAPVPIALRLLGLPLPASCSCTLCCAHTTSVAPSMERPTAMWPGHQLSFCHVLGLQKMQPSRHPLRFFSLNPSLGTEEAGECLLHG